MTLLNKKFVIESVKRLTVELVEDFIIKSGFIPLRWAVVRVENNCYTINSSVIKNC